MVKITGMSVRNAAPNKGGTRIMAFFDFHTDDIGLRGCALVKNNCGIWHVWTPMIDPGSYANAERKLHPVGVYWRSAGDLEERVLAAALDMYRIMDGGVPMAKTVPEPESDDRNGLMRALGVDAIAETMEGVG